MDQKDIQIDFPMFLMSLASAAYCSLGVVPSPVTQKTEKNLVLAKQQINLIEILKDKTKGNLTKDEEQLMESILYQLHMAYVKSTENTGTTEEKKNEEKKH